MKIPIATMRWLFIALAATVVVGCDLFDDDDDDNDSGPVDVVVLPTYAYTMISVADDPITVVAPLLEEGDVTLALGHAEGGGMFGTYTVEDGTFTIDVGSDLEVTEVGTTFALYGDFSIDVTTTWVFPPEGPPTQGAFTLTGFMQTADVEVTTEGALRVVYEGGMAPPEEVVLSFEQLDEIMDDPETPTWQKWVIFALQIGGDFVPELASYGIGGFDLIVDELADVSPVTVACDAFSSIGLAVPPPPPTIPDEGMLTFTWVDDAADGSVGPGDSFDMDTMYCLSVVEPLEDEQIMLNGLVGLNSYTEVVTNNTLVRIGFEGTSPAGRDGGVHFDDLERYEVYGSQGTTVAHLGALINGRMTLVFTEPAD